MVGVEPPVPVGRPSWAIIDIGSNSVRLVIYDGPAAAPLTVLNEKALCGLGERDLKTGELREEAVDSALNVLARYKVILNATQPKTLVVFATAAARDAPNGQEFLSSVRSLGLEVFLLSGEEEARFAALGILSSAPEILARPGGAIGGDIGGGSLELCHIDAACKDHLGPKVSLPLGALRLSSEFGSDLRGARRHIEATLDKVEWLADCPATALYVVGGAWRGLARIAMVEDSYPLEMLDHFTLLRRDVAQLCDRVSSAPISTLEAMPCVQSRRAATLPFAALVLEAVFKRMNGERVVVSSSGVREGVMFDRLNAEQKAGDPLLVLAEYAAATSGGNFTPDVDAIAQFLEPIFASDFISHRRLWGAAITLSQATLTHHPEMRAEQAAHTTMGLPLRGVGHRERVMLATALYFRHGGRSGDLYKAVPVSLLDDQQLEEAKRVGYALRFALKLDPNGRGVLPHAQLVIDDDCLRLTLADHVKAVWNRGPERRFEKLAASLGMTAALSD